MDMETKAKVLELWQQKVTSYQISERLGVSRNSVLGFIRRSRKKGVQLRTREVVARKEEAVTKRPVTTSVVIQKPRPIEVLFDYAPPAHGLTISALRHDSCRFIVAEDETPIYCGKQKERGSYCAEHYSICYVSVRKAMKDKIERMARST